MARDGWMASEADLFRIIGRIYDAATNPGTLQQLASELSSEFASNMAILYILQNPGGRSTDLLLSATATFDDWAHASYTGYFRQRDVWAHRIVTKQAPAVLHGLELIDRRDLERLEVYADYYRKTGIHHALAGIFPVAGDLGIITMSRPSWDDEYDDIDRARLNVLVPHLQRAIQIQQRLSAAEQQRSLSFDILEQLALGVVLVGMNLRILFANGVARHVLRAGDALMSVQGSLRARSRPQAAKLEKLLHEAVETSVGRGMSSGGFISLQSEAMRAFPVLIAPYRPALGTDGHFQGAALVMFSDPRVQTAAPDKVIAEMFGISPAEGRLASALISGESLADYAARIGISMNTAKTQMRQIFHKTGHRRQVELIRAALDNPIVRLSAS
jgi:DNA-binding CsgD family transcriptional regulator